MIFYISPVALLVNVLYCVVVCYVVDRRAYRAGWNDCEAIWKDATYRHWKECHSGEFPPEKQSGKDQDLSRAEPIEP